MNTKAFEGAFNLLCGAKLGEGIHRRVFECTLDASLVVKVEHNEDFPSFSNVYEFRNWEDCSEMKEVRKWLAPCVSISPCGLVMLQKRVIPLRDKELPKQLPEFLTDVKPCNYGWFNGHIVACDYPRLISNIGLKLRKTEWF